MVWQRVLRILVSLHPLINNSEMMLPLIVFGETWYSFCDILMCLVGSIFSIILSLGLFFFFLTRHQTCVSSCLFYFDVI